MQRQVGLTRLALACVALAALAPVAEADHRYSHQLVVVGRVVDANGDPVPGSDVALSSTVPLGDACVLGDREPRTDERGDFRLCRHVHAIPEGTTVTVVVEGVEATLPVEPGLRRAYFDLRLAGETPVHSLQGERAFHRNVSVTGRLMDERPGGFVDEDGQRVAGEPRAGRAVLASVFGANGTLLAQAEATTDENGDFEAWIPMDEVPEAALARIDAEGLVRDAPLDPRTRRADLAVLVAAPPPPAPLPGAGTPGFDLPLAAVALTLAAAAGAARGRPRPPSRP